MFLVRRWKIVVKACGVFWYKIMKQEKKAISEKSRFELSYCIYHSLILILAEMLVSWLKASQTKFLEVYSLEI